MGIQVIHKIIFILHHTKPLYEIYSPDHFTREDLAAAVVTYVCSDLAQLALNHAVSLKVRNVILCGTLISHPLIRQEVAKHFLATSLGYFKAV